MPNSKELLFSLALLLFLISSISFYLTYITIQIHDYENGGSPEEQDKFVILHLDDTPKPPEVTIIDAEKELEEMETIPFYMYPESNLTLQGTNLYFLPKRIHRAAAEMLYDLATIKILRESTWRTNNPNEAELFIIPIPMGMISTSVRHEFFDSTMSYLVNHTLFQRTNGHKHVLIATPFPLFRGDWKLNQHGMLSKWLPYLWNVTLASSWDQNAIVNLSQNNFDFYEYTTSFKKMKPLTKKTFSVGLTGGTNYPLKGLSNINKLKTHQFPLTLASLEKFKNSSNLVFYHSPLGHNCYHNSTIHRNAPITNVTLDTFPKSSIGNGFSDRETWLELYKDSKFCLCIRGDSPHSHAFFRAVRSGCIPVVSSDFLPIFSPILKSTLNMEDYAIILNEQDLVRDTQNTLLKLQDLDEDIIKSKIEHLKFVQRVWFHDHPKTLFVQAFLKEALHASEVDNAMNPYPVKKL